MINIRSTYRLSEEYARFAIAALFGISALALLGVIFFSPTLVLAAVFGVAVLVVSFFRPTWTLYGLLLYLPFEPFLLKWVPDDLYLFARYFSEGLIYLLLIAVIWKWIVGSLKPQSTPIDIPFALFCLVAIASAAMNAVPMTAAILGIRQILRFILLFFITYYLAPTKQWIQRLVIALVAILGIQMLLGFGQAIIGESLDTFLLPSEVRTYGTIQLTAGTEQFWDYGQRVFGTMGRYDQLGTFVAVVMLILLGLLYEKAIPTRWRSWAMVLLGLAFPLLALTYSRSSWFGFLLGAAIIAMALKRDRRVMMTAGIAGVIVTIYLLFSGLVVENLIDTPNQTLVERFFEAFSYERWRGEYYGLGRLFWIIQTITIVVPAAFLFGHGPSMYGGGAVAALRNTQVYEELSLPFGVYGTEGYIDNNWFSLWGEVGTVGLILYLWLFATCFFGAYRIWRRSKDSFTRGLALALCGILFAVAVNAFLATFLEVRTLMPFIWVLAAAVFVLGAKERLVRV